MKWCALADFKPYSTYARNSPVMYWYLCVLDLLFEAYIVLAVFLKLKHFSDCLCQLSEMSFI